MKRSFEDSARLLVPFWLLGALLGGLCLSASAVPSTVYAAFGMAKVERDVTYANPDGVALKMDIYRPLVSRGLLPAIVYVHGGGWYSGDKSEGIAQSVIPELVARGYVVAAVNYRLAPRYKFPAQIEDVKSAVRFLRANAARYGLDDAHIGAWGDSAGGHLVALLGVTVSDDGFQGTGYDGYSDRVQAVVDMYGPCDLSTFYESDNSPHIEHVFGTTDRRSPTIARASPVTHVSSDDPPFLIIHGDKDDVVLLQQSQMLYERLVSADVPATLLVVRNGGHRFTPTEGPISPGRSDITDAIADFFGQYLKCCPSPASLS